MITTMAVTTAAIQVPCHTKAVVTKSVGWCSLVPSSWIPETKKKSGDGRRGNNRKKGVTIKAPPSFLYLAQPRANGTIHTKHTSRRPHRNRRCSQYPHPNPNPSTKHFHTDGHRRIAKEKEGHLNPPGALEYDAPIKGQRPEPSPRPRRQKVGRRRNHRNEHPHRQHNLPHAQEWLISHIGTKD